MRKRKETSIGVKRIKYIILSALAALDKMIKNDTPYEHMPPELLVGAKLNLSTWSPLATDKCFGVIATNAESSSLVVLNLSGAENITDIGLQSLSGCTSSLQYLNLTTLTKSPVLAWRQ